MLKSNLHLKQQLSQKRFASLIKNKTYLLCVCVFSLNTFVNTCVQGWVSVLVPNKIMELYNKLYRFFRTL